MPYMTRTAGVHLVKLLIVGMVVQLGVIGYVLYSSYQGRVDLINAQRHGCVRGKLDRRANARGWRTAQHRSLSQHQPRFSKIYNGIASGLDARSRIDCTKVFPSASLLP